MYWSYKLDLYMFDIVASVAFPKSFNSIFIYIFYMISTPGWVEVQLQTTVELKTSNSKPQTCSVSATTSINKDILQQYIQIALKKKHVSVFFPSFPPHSPLHTHTKAPFWKWRPHAQWPPRWHPYRCHRKPRSSRDGPLPVTSWVFPKIMVSPNHPF